MKGKYIRTQEIKLKQSKAHIGITPWNKGLTIIDLRIKKNIDNRLSTVKRKKAERIFKNRSEWQLGNKHWNWKGGLPNCLGCSKKLTRRYFRRCKECMGFSMKGKNHHNWRGGHGSERHNLMKQKEYQLWRIAVFMRDDYTCQSCGDNKGGNLQAEHIKSWALYPELRYAINNGRTLCKNCHKETETWGQQLRFQRRVD